MRISYAEIIKEAIILLISLLTKKGRLQMTALMKAITLMALTMIFISCEPMINEETTNIETEATFESMKIERLITRHPSSKFATKLEVLEKTMLEQPKEFINIRMIAEPRKESYRSEIEIEYGEGKAHYDSSAFFQRVNGTIYGNAFSTDANIGFMAYYFIFPENCMYSHESKPLAVLVKIDSKGCVIGTAFRGQVTVNKWTDGKSYEILIEKAVEDSEPTIFEQEDVYKIINNNQLDQNCN